GVSLQVREATTVALVGESGSGKTTLGRAIIGLVPAREGSIRFAGAELLGLSDRAFKPHRRAIAMMFQDPVASLSPRLTIRALVTEPFRIHRLSDRDLKAEAPRLLAMVGLSADFLDRYPHELSGGQARRVGTARALALEPRLIIADEPTAGLDVSVQGEILNLALLATTPRPDPALRRAEVELKGEIPSLANRPPACEFHTRCPFVQTRCRAEAPTLREVAPGHFAACHFPFPTPQR
ncbi:MAG: hypothetical protein K0S96_1711, partial [Geminicoccaceae bacterium]|nr:hypothetical protein [Geminicoccaceae bacterium]